MGTFKKGPTEGGSGGNRGHSNMEHSVYFHEHKDASRRRRRLDARQIAQEAKLDSNAKPNAGAPPPPDADAVG